MSSVPAGDLGFFRGFPNGLVSGFRLESPSSSFGMDGERREFVAAPSRLGVKKDGRGILDLKTAMALKSHSEAERLRRERINGHLAVLRRMVPCANKLDKAALLAQVINHVKKLKKNAAENSRGHTIPSDADEVLVEIDRDATNSGIFIIKASICCDDRPDIIADLMQTLQSLHLKILKGEIATLNSRVKNVLVMTPEGNSGIVDKHLFATSVRLSLEAILDKASSQVGHLPRSLFPNKRRRILPFEDLTSSSSRS